MKWTSRKILLIKLFFHVLCSDDARTSICSEDSIHFFRFSASNFYFRFPPACLWVHIVELDYGHRNSVRIQQSLNNCLERQIVSERRVKWNDALRWYPRSADSTSVSNFLFSCLQCFRLYCSIALNKHGYAMRTRATYSDTVKKCMSWCVCWSSHLVHDKCHTPVKQPNS